MRKLPIDTAGLSFLCAISPQEVVDEYKRPKADRTTGEVLFTTQLVVLGDEGAEVIKVVTAGAPRVAQGSMVTVTDLVATPWSIEGRNGIAFRATRIDPAPGSGNGASPASTSVKAS